MRPSDNASGKALGADSGAVRERCAWRCSCTGARLAQCVDQDTRESGNGTVFVPASSSRREGAPACGREEAAGRRTGSDKERVQKKARLSASLPRAEPSLAGLAAAQLLTLPSRPTRAGTYFRKRTPSHSLSWTS